jgi:hypothetical protein
MAADANRENLRRVLIAAAPLFAEPPQLPPILQPMTTVQLLGYLSMVTREDYNRILLLLQPTDRERARPEQGGQHITEDWLRSLKSRDCQWRFRYANSDLCCLPGFNPCLFSE